MFCPSQGLQCATLLALHSSLHKAEAPLISVINFEDIKRLLDDKPPKLFFFALK
ncbi:hypothetical protein AVDCRST_MAG92-4507 [uncultured Coleofasciculus sp.]|uniref:Uncharacterized protein n=1 Tax=uncultured Coleofasciculus sp. TaxID=1267456 RepID=A0A6J4K1Z2_9CYAN|nr:hypothetical protein AVDCRST_MAG92-4507 [uncultured Coleofasciculus sp.]